MPDRCRGAPAHRSPDRDGFVHLASFRFDGNRLFINTAIGQRNLDVDEPLAQGYDDLTGSYYVTLRSMRGAAVEAWGGRGLEYSIAEDTFYYLDIRNGLAGSARLGTRARVRVFGEMGKNEYPATPSRARRTTSEKRAFASCSFQLLRALIEAPPELD